MIGGGILPLLFLTILAVVIFFILLWKAMETPYQSDGVPRSRLTYILLALFGGTLGLHNFYAGYKRRGLLAIILTVTVFGLIFSILMAFYDIITVTHDAAGIRFKE